jgi:VanZ family protein
VTDPRQPRAEVVPRNGGNSSGVIRLPSGVIAVLCLLITCATLTAGLRPFYVPANEVQWLQGENGLAFGEHGTAITSGPLAAANSGGPCSLEAWLAPGLTWATGAVLAFHNSPSGQEFSIQQDYSDLVLQLRGERQGRNNDLNQLEIDEVFRRPQVFLTITSDGRSASVYLNGKLATRAFGFPLTIGDLSGQLILANQPLRNHSWPGQIKGLAIYESELNPAQVASNYQGWKLRGSAVLDGSEHALAVYSFSEHSGGVAHNSVADGADLNIPKKFVVVDQFRFESPISEFRAERHYAKDVAINILGFVPLGFLFCLYFTIVRRTKHAALYTVIVGLVVSLTIEYFQSFLPTRYSGVTDLFTNTSGAGLGVLVYRVYTRLSSRWGIQFFTN